MFTIFLIGKFEDRIWQPYFFLTRQVYNFECHLVKSRIALVVEYYVSVTKCPKTQRKSVKKNNRKNYDNRLYMRIAPVNIKTTNVFLPTSFLKQNDA